MPEKWIHFKGMDWSAEEFIGYMRVIQQAATDVLVPLVFNKAPERGDIEKLMAVLDISIEENYDEEKVD